MAYELDFSKNSKIHNVFHVSWLKKVLGQVLTPCEELPPLDDEGQLTLVLEVILDKREKKIWNKTITEFLTKWKNLPERDTTWEKEAILELLEEKQIRDRRTAMNLN